MAVELSPELLEILACPNCHGALAVDHERDELVCLAPDCGLAYPVRQGIPVLLIDEARRPDNGLMSIFDDSWLDDRAGPGRRRSDPAPAGRGRSPGPPGDRGREGADPRPARPAPTPRGDRRRQRGPLHPGHARAGLPGAVRGLAHPRPAGLGRRAGPGGGDGQRDGPARAGGHRARGRTPGRAVADRLSGGVDDRRARRLPVHHPAAHGDRRRAGRGHRRALRAARAAARPRGQPAGGGRRDGPGRRGVLAVRRRLGQPGQGPGHGAGRRAAPGLGRLGARGPGQPADRRGVAGGQRAGRPGRRRRRPADHPGIGGAARPVRRPVHRRPVRRPPALPGDAGRRQRRGPDPVRPHPAARGRRAQRRTGLPDRPPHRLRRGALRQPAADRHVRGACLSRRRSGLGPRVSPA